MALPQPIETATPVQLPVERVSLDTATPKPETVSIDTGVEAPRPVPPETASPRALKAEFGIGKLTGKSFEEIYNNLVTGGEDSMRAEAAAAADRQKLMHRNQVIVDYAKQKGAGVTSQEVAHIDATLKSLNEPTASNSVFEEYFSKEYLDLVQKTGEVNPDSSMYKAIKEIPKQVQHLQEASSEILTRRLFALTMAEDMEAKVHEQSYPGYIADFAKGLIPFYPQVKTSGLVPGVSSFMGKGSNWEAQAQALWLLPVPEYKAKLTEIANNLSKDNPQLAAEFIRAVAGQSNSDIALGNLFTAIDISAIKPLATIGAAKSLARRVGIFGAAQRDYKAMLDAAVSPGVLESAPARIEAAGNFAEAGIQEFSVRTAKQLAGKADPADNLKTLPPALRAELTEREANLGSHTRETVNRLNETTSKNSFLLTDVIDNIMRVERTPALVAVEKTARAALDKFKEDYVGHFVTNERVVAGPAGTNTKFFRADMLMPDGALFPDELTAKLYAHNNGIAIRGEDPIKALELQTKIKIAEGQLGYYVKAMEAESIGGSPVRLGQPQPFPKDPVLLTPANKTPKFAENMKALEDKIAGYKTELEGIKNRPGAVIAAPDAKAGGYVIQFTNPLNETDSLIRGSLLDAPGAATPGGWLNSLIGKFRTTEDTLSIHQRENRKAATYAPSILMEAAQELGKDVESLAKWTLPFTSRRERWKDFERVLDATRNVRSPIDGEPGYLFKTPGELDVFYQQTIGRLPDAQEMRAFFGYKDLVEMHDSLYRNTVYSKMSRVGTQTHSFSLIDDTGKAVKGPDFNGTIQNTMPGGDAAVLVVGKNAADSYVYYGGSLSPKGAKTIKEGILGKTVKSDITDEYKAFVDSGEREVSQGPAKEIEERFIKGELKVVKLYDDSKMPFKGFAPAGERRIQYVITDKLETRPLSWDQVPARKSGFFNTEYEHYLAQPIIRKESIGKEMRHWYEGDRIIMPVSIRAMGRDIEKKLNDVRELIRDNKIDEARAYTQANLPIKFDEIHSWFKESLNAQGVRESPRLNFDEPIRLAQRNKLLGHMDNSLRDKYEAVQRGSYKDGTRFGYMDKEAEQALFQSTITDAGTVGNPLYKVAPVKYIDPLSNMNRSLTRMVNTSQMEDYKIFSVEHWIQEAKGFLKADANELAHSPYNYFFNAEFRDGAPKDVVARLKAQNYQIQQLLGIPSETDGVLHSLAQSMHDSIYLKAGSKAADMLTPMWLLPKLKDPFSFLRSMAFHAKLGLFNIPQLLVQSQTFVNIMGVAGIKYAAPGTKAALLHQWARVNSNPEILQSLDNLATKQIIPGTSRYKPGEWLEAYQYGKTTGIFNVAGEYAARDDLYSSKVVSSGKNQILNWGSAPFREGEKGVRAGAWYTAFKEFRDLHPTGRVTDQDLKGILNRADLLTVNMSRASNSALHTGVMSIPTQFLSYQIRTFEQFLSKRLTTMEKARLFGTYAAVYGVPTALGVTGLPLGDLLRKDALEQGYVVGDRWIESAVHEGLPSMLLKLTTGNFYNVSERYGIQGFSTIREAMRSDQPWWKVFGGAAFSTIAGTVENTDGFTKAMMSGIRGDGKFPFKVDDIIEPFKEIASINAAWKVGMALHAGRWMSKKEGFVDRDITPANAIFMGLTGLQSQRATDVNLVTWSQKNQKELETEGLNGFVKEFRRAQLALKDNNQEQHIDYMKRAFNRLRLTGYPQDKYDKAISIAANGYETMIERLDYSFYFDNAPDAVKRVREQAYRKILQQNRITREKK